jgi:nucleoside-diphosphate-sugar epimerase
MKILIIGNGFLATSIVQRLQSEGNETMVFSRSFNPLLQCNQILGDVFNFKEFMHVLEWKPEIIVHSAWITTPGIYRDDLSNIKYAHFTFELARAVRESEVKHLIVLGTCAEYGKQLGPSTAGITKLSPISLYAEQKVAAFNMAKAQLMDSNTRLTWARVFYPYGPNQDKKRLIPYLIDSLKSGRPILLDDISSVHDWISTRDVSSAISWIIRNATPVEIDIGTSQGVTNLELMEKLEGILQIPNQIPKSSTHSLGLNDYFVVAPGSPLLKSGWTPQDTLNSGLEWVLRL